MKQKTNTFQSKTLPWLIFSIITVFVIGCWLHGINWSLKSITALNLFPLLGIYAWSIMWTHYILGANRILKPNIAKNKLYAQISSALVLILILLHPGLLIWSQWQNLNITPPDSIYNYVETPLRIFVAFGSISFLLFLSFDLLSRLKSKSFVAQNWHWVSLSQVLAMILIFIHGITLGYILDNLVFKIYWIVLGLSLLPCFVLMLRHDFKNRQIKLRPQLN